jgi:hypothetical protein
MDIPIIIAAYNRPASLERLLYSLQSAHYFKKVKLYISIDGGDNKETVAVAGNFVWKHGDKEIIKHVKNFGLRKHILFCGGISKQHDGIILLEDDLFVSPYFYNFAQTTAKYYEKDKNITGISLYTHAFNETAQLPFKPFDDGSDVFFLQIASSWGQYWSKHHWLNFIEWYEKKPDCTFSENDNIPSDIVRWPKTSWKKHFIKYMILNNLYFVYPRFSYTTNFGDIGVHHKGNAHFQVSLCFGLRNFTLEKFTDSKCKYDAYCEILPECLNQYNSFLSQYDYAVDLYGMKPLKNCGKRYALTARSTTKSIVSFDQAMFPHEMNIMNEIKGKYFSLSNVSDIQLNPSEYCSETLLYYHRMPAWSMSYSMFKNSKEQKIIMIYRNKMGKIILAPFLLLYKVARKLRNVVKYKIVI